MQYFIVGDVHGHYVEMLNALSAKGFDISNPNHTFVSLGDLMDRGPRNLDCMNYVLNLPRRILIRGNHEDLLDKALERGYIIDLDHRNGTSMTYNELLFTSLTDGNDRAYQKYYLYRSILHDYYETGDMIFVHGWIPHLTYQKGFNCDYTRHDYWSDWRVADVNAWAEARWFNGMECWADGVREPNKTIFCGHWHTSWGHSHLEHAGPEFGSEADFSPFIAQGIVAVDGCVVTSKKVNCVVVEGD